jgi:hypothetical protein
MQLQRRRGSIAPANSWSGHWMGWVVSVTPRPHFTPAKGPRYPLDRRLGGPQSRSGHRLKEKFLTCAEDRTPVVQSVVRHYTDRATSVTYYISERIFCIFHGYHTSRHLFHYNTSNTAFRTLFPHSLETCWSSCYHMQKNCEARLDRVPYPVISCSAADQERHVSAWSTNKRQYE